MQYFHITLTTGEIHDFLDVSSKMGLDRFAMHDVDPRNTNPMQEVKIGAETTELAMLFSKRIAARRNDLSKLESAFQMPSHTR